MALHHVNLDIYIYGNSSSHSQMKAVSFSMNLTVVLTGNVTDFKAYGDVTASDIEPGSFLVTS